MVIFAKLSSGGPPASCSVLVVQPTSWFAVAWQLVKHPNKGQGAWCCCAFPALKTDLMHSPTGAYLVGLKPWSGLSYKVQTPVCIC
jgi:hypothetical protein